MRIFAVTSDNFDAYTKGWPVRRGSGAKLLEATQTRLNNKIKIFFPNYIDSYFFHPA